MRFVPVKSDEQLDLQSLHRVRERWVMRRTAVVNQARGLLLERGIMLFGWLQKVLTTGNRHRSTPSCRAPERRPAPAPLAAFRLRPVPGCEAAHRPWTVPHAGRHPWARPRSTAFF